MPKKGKSKLNLVTSKSKYMKAKRACESQDETENRLQKEQKRKQALRRMNSKILCKVKVESKNN